MLVVLSGSEMLNLELRVISGVAYFVIYIKKTHIFIIGCVVTILVGVRSFC